MGVMEGHLEGWMPVVRPVYDVVDVEADEVRYG